MIKLGPIQMVEPKKLKRNAKNAKYFKIESKQYFDNLAADIQLRGILVPLVARADGTLLAGHNRLTVAELLSIKKVPVQYVQGKVSDAEETAYIIKDNLLRRHLSYGERLALYRKMIKDFDTRILVPGKLGVSNRELAEKTGLNPRTVNYDLNKHRHDLKKELARGALDAPNDKAIDNFKKAVARMLNVAIIEQHSTITAFKALIQHADKQLSTMLDNKQAIDTSRIQRRRLR